MRLRPRRRNLVVWSSTASPVGRSRAAPRRAGAPRRRGARPARLRRIRWWLRTGALLTVLGVLRLARTARVRWEPVCLLAGVVIAGTGFALPGGGGLFMLGVLVLIVTLLKGIAAQQRRRDPARLRCGAGGATR
jgi:hypothetical protein